MRALACAMGLASLGLLVGQNALAEQPPEANPAAKSSAPPKLARASIARVAETLALGLANVPQGALVVAAPLASDAPALRGSELVLLVASQIAGRIGAGARAHTAALSLVDAREAARKSPALVYVSTAIATGKLRVTVDVFPVPRTVWARIRDPEPGPFAHAFAEAPVDAEVRSFLAPVPLTAANVVRARNFESDVVALACGDLDGDGALEILSVSRRRVTTLRLREGKVVPLRSRTWADLSPPAASPLREPLGFAGLVERGAEDGSVVSFADVGVTDRAKALRLDAELSIVAPLSGLPLALGETSGCARVAAPFVAVPLAACAAGEPVPAVLPAGSFDALASAALVSTRGEPFVVVASRDDRGSTSVRDDAGHRVAIEGLGAQLAVGDLDQDGDPEILGGLDVASARGDAVVVRSWSRALSGDAARPKETLRLPAAAGVQAIGVCPPDGPARAPFVVATADEIWVVR